MKEAFITLLLGLLTALILPFVAFRYHKLFTVLRFISDWPPNQYEYTDCEDSETIIEVAQEVVEPEESEQELTDKSIIQEAIGGLCYVGFKKTEAKKAVSRVCNDYVFTSSEELIKAALDRSNV